MQDNTEENIMADMDVSTPENIELPPTSTAPAAFDTSDVPPMPAIPSLPPGWNPSHIPGLMHPADAARVAPVADGQATLPGFAPVGPPPGVPTLSPDQVAHQVSEEGCEAVRAIVVLPTMPDAYHHVETLRAVLRVAQSVGDGWLGLGDEVLGELTHSVPGINAVMLNVASFAAQANEMLVRASGRPSEWCEVFEAIVRESSHRKAWRLLALASSALLAGPFTAAWDDAVDWCMAFWDER